MYIPIKYTHKPLQTILIVDGGLKSIDGKGDNAGKDGGSTVDHGNNDGLALKVIVVLVVAGKSYERPKAQTQREKDLSGCIDPRSRVGKLFHLGANKCVHMGECTHAHTQQQQLKSWALWDVIIGKGYDK